MKPGNIVAILEGNSIIETAELIVDKSFVSLKKHEIRNVNSFCNIMASFGCTIGAFDGFFVGYSIAQIGKEFDLLRFGDKYILNIEIKSELKIAKKEDKLLKQMRENYYYLNFLNKAILIYTYVENDGFYAYDAEKDSLVIANPIIIAGYLANQKIDYTVDPDKAFIPTNYLVSPFNSTNSFIDNRYFLTSAQQRIKTEIQSELFDNPFMFFCISANAGTGKTLLLYDIAKDLMAIEKRVLIIHCGMLNRGHLDLNSKHNWQIKSIKEIPNSKDFLNLDGYDFIFIDESQRIRIPQLTTITNKALEKKIPIIFSFDTKQYLRSGETLDISNYLSENHPQILTSTKRLTNKIRTNKAMASFITNMFNIGKSRDNLDYECVTVEYISDIHKLKEYICFLKTIDWIPITYTTSSKYIDPYDNLADLCDKNAHEVIGQEFSKVVFVMDENFRYSEDNRLTVKNSYYSAKGMLYQIVTRAISELKIVVVNNPCLYSKLLSIKALGL